jgi:TPR repeat protein
MLARGDGVRRNLKQAAFWFTKGAELEDPSSLRELALIYKDGLGVTQDLHKARQLMAHAASLGDEPALEWINVNLPQKPEWLLRLTQPQQGAANDAKTSD